MKKFFVSLDPKLLFLLTLLFGAIDIITTLIALMEYPQVFSEINPMINAVVKTDGWVSAIFIMCAMKLGFASVPIWIPHANAQRVCFLWVMGINLVCVVNNTIQLGLFFLS
jgi:hypothetical protein